ncbi:hypothetical protein BDV23DRAFT_188715 [Aspergillus alliaceus]|uniref:Uncharacterized protein n=1 Tax=Petromyces alliaceus TaxID=209559 RepID=A0A5N7BT21_PETAA|nr:hypothetical protein BDV23DRAFT_188715 [Aspergillus alliaceus]
MPPKWPAPPVTTTHISEAVFLVREHCRRVGAFAQENPKCRATAQYLDEVMGVVDNLLGRIQHKNMTTNRHDAQATRAHIQHIHELLKQTQPPAGASEGPIQPPAAPLQSMNSKTPTGFGSAAIDKTELKGTQVRAAQIHPSGDIDLYADSPEDCDRLIRHRKAWTRHLPHHKRIQVVSNQFTILVHGVPRDWFSKQSLENGEAGGPSSKTMPQRFRTRVSYTWIGRGARPWERSRKGP